MIGRIGAYSTRSARWSRPRVLLLAAAIGLLAIQGATAQAPAPNAAGAPAIQAVGLANGVLVNPDDPAGSVLTVDATGRPTSLPPVSSGTDRPPGTPGVAALTINAVFDASITGDGNAAAIQNTINQAIAVYQSILTDPITVKIEFHEMATGLGSSSTYFANVSYSTYLSALKADATTFEDATANSHLPTSSTNPVNGSSTINVKMANLRAVGISSSPPGTDPDGFIGLRTSITSPGSPGTTGQFDLLAVVEHEIDEVLGLGSALPTPQFSTIFPEDLFRYNGSGARTWTTTSSVLAYFSIDGPTQIAQFDNQNDGGDFGDWQSNPRPAGVPAKVQDAFATPGAHPTLGNAELTALDVIGFNPGGLPTISSQPQSQTIAFGQAATMSVTASGSGLSYQWYAGSSGVTVNPVGTNSNTYTTPALTNNTKYWVRVSNSAGSVDSNTAQITVSFTDGTVTAKSTSIKAVHITELRTRINGVRARFNLMAFPFAEPINAGSTQIKASHINELRTALAEAYSAAMVSPPTYATDPTLTTGTVVKAAHITEIRSNVTAIE